MQDSCHSNIAKSKLTQFGLWILPFRWFEHQLQYWLTMFSIHLRYLSVEQCLSLSCTALLLLQGGSLATLGSVNVARLAKSTGATGASHWLWGETDGDMVFRCQLILFMWTCVLLLLWVLTYSLLSYLHLLWSHRDKDKNLLRFIIHVI